MTVNAVKFLGTGSDDVALALKVYTGSFFEPWRNSTHFWDAPENVINKQTVAFGKQFQYLRLAEIPAPEDFNPGNELIGQDFAVDEVNITPDKYLVCHQMIPRDQMQISHFEILPRLAASHARRIARAYDQRVALLACAAARQTTSVTKNSMTVHLGGTRVTRGIASTSSGSAVITTPYPASATGAANLRADARLLRRRMAEKNLPEDPYAWCRPDILEMLMYDNTAQVFSRDYNATNDVMARKLTDFEGFKLNLRNPNTTSNGGSLPDQDLSGNSLAKYQYNFLPQAADGTPVFVALTTHPEGGAAVGVVTYEDVQHHVGYYPEKMSWLVMSFLFVGAGILDPWCAGTVEAIT
jgi:hypothetical protein